MYLNSALYEMKFPIYEMLSLLVSRKLSILLLIHLQLTQTSANQPLYPGVYATSLSSDMQETRIGF